MSLASEILALLRAGSQGEQRVLPNIAGELERLGPRSAAPAMEADALARQLSRGAMGAEPPVNEALAAMHQPQLPLETEDPRFLLALQEDQRVSPLEKQALELHPAKNRFAGDSFRRTGPLVPDESVFPEQRPADWMPEDIPEDTLQHESGLPRVMDSEVQRRLGLAQDIPPAAAYEALPAREAPELPPISPRLDQLPETIEPELHPGVLREPEFRLDTPVMAKLHELTKVQRLPIDERLQTKFENARSYIRQAFPNKEALVEHNLGPNQVAPHRPDVDETGAFANELLNKWEQRIRGGLAEGEGETGRVGKNDRLALKEFISLIKHDPHAAVALLADVTTGTKGEVSDYTGRAQVEGIIKTNSKENRQRMAGQFRSAGKARVEAGLAAPADPRNQQYAPGKSRIPVQTEEIVNPEAVTGIRPGVSEDPFEAVRNGQQRSILVGDKELQQNTGISGKRMAPGSTIMLSSGEGKVIPATVVAVRRVTEHDAAEVGLRQGVTPMTMKQMIQQSEARGGPQFEVVFKPVAAQKEGLAGAGAVTEAVAAGKQSAKEAYAGVGVHNPLPQLPKENEAWLKAQGYNMDELNFPRSKNPGSPYIAQGKNLREFWTEDVVARMREPGWADTPARKKHLADAEAALKDPSKGRIVPANQIRPKSAATFRNQKRDASAISSEPNIGSTMLSAEPETKVKGITIGRNQEGTYSFSMDGGKTWADRFFRTPQEARENAEHTFKATPEAQAQLKGMRQVVPLGEEVTAKTVGARPTDRRDNEFRPTSVGKPVSDPQEIVSQMRKGAPKGSFFLAEHYKPGFAREASDATLDIGENVAARASDPKAIMAAVGAINAKVKGTLKDRKQIILNITGPDMHALRGSKLTSTGAPGHMKETMKAVLSGLMDHPGRGFDIVGILTEGQSGMQEAAVLAARELGIPVAAVMPPHMQMRHPASGRGLWVPREIHEARFRGEDVSAHLNQLSEQAAKNIAAAKARK